MFERVSSSTLSDSGCVFEDDRAPVYFNELLDDQELFHLGLNEPRTVRKCSVGV